MIVYFAISFIETIIKKYDTNHVTNYFYSFMQIFSPETAYLAYPRYDLS